MSEAEVIGIFANFILLRSELLCRTFYLDWVSMHLHTPENVLRFNAEKLIFPGNFTGFPV